MEQNFFIMNEFFANISYYFEEYFVDYITVNCSLWISWLLWLGTIFFILLPCTIYSIIGFAMVILWFYKHHRYRFGNSSEADFADVGKRLVCAMWEAHGYIWHGYEVEGLENIPEKTGALFVMYHGTLPVDAYYLISKVYLIKSRCLQIVGDRFLFKIPGWTYIAESFKVVTGDVESCSAALMNNDLMIITPGGVYEAQFSDSSYKLMWKKRRGFAKVALRAKVPIIPIFTRNIGEAYRTLGLVRKFLLKVYERTKLPLVPIYGGFPVKLTTHIGKPIPYDPNMSPEELAVIVARALEDLIAKKQRIPGSILHALWERFYQPKTKGKSD